MQTPQLPIPNPEDWCDAYEAARLLGVDHSTVFRMSPNSLRAYRLGAGRVRHYWVPDVKALASARRLVAGADPCASGCSNPAAHAEGGHDV